MLTDNNKEVEMEGLCKCGCGLKTRVARQNRKHLGHVKGQPVPFIQGHWIRTDAAMKVLAPCRKINLTKLKHAYLPSNHGDGYVTVHDHETKTRRLQHRVMAERALGRRLQGTEEVHHVNGVRDDNRNGNLIICPNRAYHSFIHQRERAYRACGQAHWRKCATCKQYDAPENLYVPPSGKGTIVHRACSRGTR